MLFQTLRSCALTLSAGILLSVTAAHAELPYTPEPYYPGGYPYAFVDEGYEMRGYYNYLAYNNAGPVEFPFLDQALADFAFPVVTDLLYGPYVDNFTTYSPPARDPDRRVIMTAKGPIEYKMAGSGPVVICLHGAPGGFDQSFLVGEHLLGSGFTIIGVSRPGYLNTPLWVGEDAAGTADAMIALMDALGIKKAAMLGFSAGTASAYQAGQRHPSRVTAVVLECIGAQPADEAGYPVLGDVLGAGVLDNYVSWLLYRSLHETPYSAARYLLTIDNNLSPEGINARYTAVIRSPEQMRFLQSLMDSVVPLSTRTDGFIADVDTVNPYYDASTYRFRSMKVPTLLVQAVNDTNGYYAEAQWITSQIPGAQLLSVEGSGHFIWLGPNTANWEAQLAAFLRGHTTGK